MSKAEQRKEWNRRRQEQNRYHPDKADVINSGAKVKKFFGEEVQQNRKLNWRIGESIGSIMDQRSMGLANITKKDDEIRKKDRSQFSRRARGLEKAKSVFSRIKISFGNKSSRNVTEVESRNFLNNDFDDLDDEKNRKASSDYKDGNESAASTQSTNTTDTDNDMNTMIIYPYQSGGLLNGDIINGHNPSIKHNRNISEPKMNIKIHPYKTEEKKSRTPNFNTNGIRNGKFGWRIDQSLFGFPTQDNPLQLGVGKRTANKRSTYFSTPFGTKSRSPSPNGVRKGYKSKNKSNPHGFKPNGRINTGLVDKQMPNLKHLLSNRRSISAIIDTFYKDFTFPVEFIVYLICQIDIKCPKYINAVSRSVDKQIKTLHNLSLWQYVLRSQIPEIDVKRFFYSFGPLIGPYKTLISPLHLAAKRLNEVAGGKESHITTHSAPDAQQAFEIFKWLLFIGYNIDDGDIDGTITPKTTLHHSPRILKQILMDQRQFLHKQKECMKVVDDVTFTNYSLLLDDDILQVIEKFAYQKYRHNRGYTHKKFAAGNI